MLTYQDFCAAGDKTGFCLAAITEHKACEAYRMAVEADAYDRQQNTTIMNYTKMLYTLTGSPVVDFTASNNKIVSNFFRRLNVQRAQYLLGNGVSFEKAGVKDKLGAGFDGVLAKLGYKALIHGVAFGFWNLNALYCFPLTEFVPFYDEESGALRAGVRFWRLSHDKPLFFVIYEEDGYTKVRSDDSKTTVLQEKRQYKLRTSAAPALGKEVVGGDNYGSLPIVPLWSSELKQSTLVGMQRAIDSYDLIRSGFANDLTDCAQIYWLVKNAGGMNDNDLAQFRDRLKLMHIAGIACDEGADAQAVTQEIPYAARTAYLERIRNGIYEDFGALDTSSISAAAKTATEINAAHQPLDEMTDDFEANVTAFLQQLLLLQGITAAPLYKRNRIANQADETQMVMTAASVLDEETVLAHLPFITVDEQKDILKRRDAETLAKFKAEPEAPAADEEEEYAETKL